MFIYEKGNSLNLTFKGSIPVDNPEVVIKGFVDGVTMTVNGTVFGSGSEEFEGKAKTLVYQKDGKLMITFRGVLGMEKPEVVIDETGDDTYLVTIGEDTVTLSIVDDAVVIGEKTTAQTTEVEEPVAPANVEEPKEEEKPEVTDPEDEIEEDEGDAE